MRIGLTEFGTVSTSLDAVRARREAIERLASEGLGNREIAKRVGCTIWTVRYWLNPQTRQHRIAYKATMRATA